MDTVRFEPPPLDDPSAGGRSTPGALAAAREAGRQEVLSEMQQVLDEQSALRDRLADALDIVEALRGHLAALDRTRLGDLEREALEIGWTIAAEVLGREARVEDDTVVAAVRRVLAEAEGREPLVLRVHPSVVGVARQHVGEGVDVVGDPAVARGDAVAVVGVTRVSSELRAVLLRLRHELGLEPGLEAGLEPGLGPDAA